MAKECVTGALMKCSFGVAPMSLIAIPKGPPVLVGGPIGATIMDHAPIGNIPPFGMCTSLANPAVASATAAAMGVLTPMPCVPVTPGPWVVGSPTVLINNFPALNDTACLMCTWGGVIKINFAGQVFVDVP